MDSKLLLCCWMIIALVAASVANNITDTPSSSPTGDPNQPSFLWPLWQLLLVMSAILAGVLLVAGLVIWFVIRKRRSYEELLD